jgi:hypothetical protein
MNHVDAYDLFCYLAVQEAKKQKTTKSNDIACGCQAFLTHDQEVEEAAESGASKHPIKSQSNNN